MSACWLRSMYPDFTVAKFIRDFVHSMEQRGSAGGAGGSGTAAAAGGGSGSGEQ